MSLPFKRFSGIEKVHRNFDRITVDLWRRARDFFGALPCTFASLRSLTTSAKTVHRTVFFRRQVCSLLVRIPLFIFANAKSRPCDLLFVLAESKGFFRRTPVHLRVASLLDHVGKNSPPDCFLPQTSLLPPCSNPFIYFCQCKKQTLRPAFRFGGEQGIRTLEQALTCYTISNRAPSASSDNSPNSFSLFN